MHSYEKVVTEPTCTEQGFTTYTCKECGKSYVDDYTDALGHDFGEWIVDVEATCVSEGKQHQTCSRCGEIQEKTISISDVHVDADLDGVCDVCGKTDICKYCGKTHEGIFGGITRVIHNLFYSLTHLFVK